MHSSSLMMNQAHWSCEVLKGIWIDWLDLPKLTSLRTGDYSRYPSFTFAYPHHITFESDSHPLWMMFRHAQSHLCVFLEWSIQVQGRHHNQRKYSLHPSLRNRHRSSCKSSKSAIKAPDSSLCATHNHFPSTSEFVHRHWRERYRCANTEIMTMSIWNNGNPIWVKETASSDHSSKSFEVCPKHSINHPYPIPIQIGVKTESLSNPQKSSEILTDILISSIAILKSP